MARQRHVWLSNPRRKYKIITSPDPLFSKSGKRCKVIRDDDDQVFWTDPGLNASARDSAIVCAVLTSMHERVPSVGVPQALVRIPLLPSTRLPRAC